MSSRPLGGYTLVEVSDNGALALPLGTIADRDRARARYDGARLDPADFAFPDVRITGHRVADGGVGSLRPLPTSQYRASKAAKTL